MSNVSRTQMSEDHGEPYVDVAFAEDQLKGLKRRRSDAEDVPLSRAPQSQLGLLDQPSQHPKQSSETCPLAGTKMDQQMAASEKQQVAATTAHMVQLACQGSGDQLAHHQVQQELQHCQQQQQMHQHQQQVEGAWTSPVFQQRQQHALLQQLQLQLGCNQANNMQQHQHLRPQCQGSLPSSVPTDWTDTACTWAQCSQQNGQYLHTLLLSPAPELTAPPVAAGPMSHIGSGTAASAAQPFSPSSSTSPSDGPHLKSLMLVAAQLAADEDSMDSSSSCSSPLLPATRATLQATTASVVAAEVLAAALAGSDSNSDTKAWAMQYASSSGSLTPYSAAPIGHTAAGVPGAAFSSGAVNAAAPEGPAANKAVTEQCAQGVHQILDLSTDPTPLASSSTGSNSNKSDQVQLPAWLCSTSVGLAASRAICRASLLNATAALARLSPAGIHAIRPTAQHQLPSLQQLHGLTPIATAATGTAGMVLQRQKLWMLKAAQ